MSKPIKKPKLNPVRAELDLDLQTVYDSAESIDSRLLIIMVQMLRFLKKIK